MTTDAKQLLHTTIAEIYRCIWKMESDSKLNLIFSWGVVINKIGDLLSFNDIRGLRDSV